MIKTTLTTGDVVDAAVGLTTLLLTLVALALLLGCGPSRKEVKAVLDFVDYKAAQAEISTCEQVRNGIRQLQRQLHTALEK